MLFVLWIEVSNSSKVFHFKVILQKQEKIISFVKIFPNAFKHNKSETKYIKKST